MKIPLLSGIYATTTPDVRVSYPVNLVPVPGNSGVSDGHLRPAEGIASFATGPGNDRGAIFIPSGRVPAAIGGRHFRVSGTSLVTVSSAGVVSASLGTISGTDLARMDFDFTRVGIAADGKLFYWNGTTLVQVSDPDVGTVNDVVWVDGFWLVTDGSNVAASDIANPESFNPLKYGSTDTPDPIQCLLKVQNELHVVSRDVIDVFQNIGGTGFPFTRIASAVIYKGAIGKRAACVFQDAVAFVGSGRNEAPGVYVGRNAQVAKISTKSIDDLLLEYTEAQLATILMETMTDRGGYFLRIHLPDRCIVFDAVASESSMERPSGEKPVWHVLTTDIDGFSKYKGINIIRAFDAWVVGDSASTAIGKLITTDSKHYGADVRWEFGTTMLRAGSKSAIIHELELVAQTGSGPELKHPTVATAYSLDGLNYSQDKWIKAGDRGDTLKRLVWRGQGRWKGRRTQRFRGDSNSRITALAIEAQVEPLEY